MPDPTQDPSVAPAATPTPAATPQGGLLGMLGGLLKNADPDLLTSVGMGLLSGARFGSNAGEGLMQGMQLYQQRKQSQQQQVLNQQTIQMNAMNMQKQQQLMGLLPSLLGQNGAQPQSAPSSASPASSASSPAAPAPQSVGPMPAQMAPQAAAQSSQQPNWLTPPTAQDIGNIPVNGVNPRLTGAYNLLSGKLPSEGAQQQLDAQKELAKQQFAPVLAQLNGVVESDSPKRDVQASPALMQTWAHYAVARGLDPQKDFNDANVRQVMGGLANAYATQLGMPTKAPPIPLINKGLQQIDPTTGKVEREEELQQVSGPNGPVLVPKSQAAGATPFNATIFGAQGVTDQAKEMAYQQWKASGGTMPTGVARNPIMNSQMLDYFAKRAKDEGLNAMSVVAQGQQTKAAAGVVKDFTSGKTSQTLNGLNTAVAHMDALDPLIDGLNNTNSPLFNKAANFFKQQVGSAAPTNFAAIKEFVGGEVAKAVLPGGGGEGERQALTAPLNAANSPEQLKQAVQQIKTALAGKTEALRNQWDVGTGGNQGNFDKFLLPPTKKALGLDVGSAAAPGSHPPDIQDLLKKYGSGT